MRTLTVKKGGGGSWKDGWNTLTINNAAYGDYNGSKYLDVWFEGLPESLNMRVYEAKNAEGEEFAIGQIFRFANAGIMEGLEGPDGNTVIKLSDDAELLKSSQLNVFIYKDGQYSRVCKQPAPTVFENAADSFSEDDVKFWKDKAENYFQKYVKPKLEDDEPIEMSFEELGNAL